MKKNTRKTKSHKGKERKNLFLSLIKLLCFALWKTLLFLFWLIKLRPFITLVTALTLLFFGFVANNAFYQQGGETTILGQNIANSVLVSWENPVRQLSDLEQPTLEEKPAASASLAKIEPSSVLAEVPEQPLLDQNDNKSSESIHAQDDIAMVIAAMGKETPSLSSLALSSTSYEATHKKPLSYEFWHKAPPVPRPNPLKKTADTQKAKLEDFTKLRNALQIFGYEDLPSKGGYDNNLAAALEQFQSVFALPQTGKADNETLAKMKEIGLLD